MNKGRLNWYGRDENWQDVIGFKGKQDIEKPMGEWNLLECIAHGNEIIIYLNGVLVNRAREVLPSKGRIQIQSEGAEIYVRHIEIAKQKNPERINSRDFKFIDEQITNLDFASCLD